MRRIAVWAVCVLALGGCKRGAGSKTAQGDATAPVLTAERDRAVDVVWFSEQTHKGGTSPAKVIVKPNPSGEVRVAIYEEFSGGAGPQWRASVWMASFLAATTLNQPLSAYEFGMSTGGLIDGPSAGALTTAGMLAALTDVPVRPEVTMTGTINPDGTVGPVGGIPQKIDGAAAKGKKVFGYPVGQRYDVDEASRNLVDVQQRAQEQKVSAEEIKDVYDAYHLLTGKTLARPSPVPASEMEISPKVFQRMQAKTSAWLDKAKRSLVAIDNHPLEKLIAKTKLADNTREKMETAQRYQRQGMVPAAFKQALMAAATGEVLQHVADELTLSMRGDVDGLLVEVNSLASVQADLRAAQAMLDTEEPKNAGQVMSLLEGYTDLASAQALIDLGDGARQDLDTFIRNFKKGQLPKEYQVVLKLPAAQRGRALGMVFGVQAMKAALFYRLASLVVDGARDLMELQDSEGNPIHLDPKAVSRLAHSYTSAAKANLDYYDSLVLQTQADAAGASMAAVKAHKENADLDYLLAERELGIALLQREKTDLNTELLVLAAAQSSYLTSAVLVAREYSLGAHKDKAGKLVVERDKALTSMLGLAEEKAREQAARAKAAAGVIPTLARSAYQNALAEREGDSESKINALSDFWGASMGSQLIAQLAAASGPLPVAAGDAP